MGCEASQCEQMPRQQAACRQCHGVYRGLEALQRESAAWVEMTSSHSVSEMANHTELAACRVVVWACVLTLYCTTPTLDSINKAPSMMPIARGKRITCAKDEGREGVWGTRRMSDTHAHRQAGPSAVLNSLVRWCCCLPQASVAVLGASESAASQALTCLASQQGR